MTEQFSLWRRDPAEPRSVPYDSFLRRCLAALHSAAMTTLARWRGRGGPASSRPQLPPIRWEM